MPATTPLTDRCQALLAAQGHSLDDAQRQVVARLEDLRRRLIARQSGRSLINKGLGLLPGAGRTPLRGLWLWGGVGRGKTFLVDQFFAGLPFAEKRREHFHRFMQEVHAGLRRQSSTPSPLKQVASEIAAQARLLCFDEFAVSDVADAMILASLLQELLKSGVTLVGTLLYMLAQPISRTELLLGKFLGLTAALCASLCVGFGVSAIPLAWKAGGIGAASYLGLVVLSCVLAVVMLALGFLISVVSRKGGVALGLGLFAWLTLVFLSDLGLMAGTLVFQLRVEELFALAILNPLQAFKMAVIVDLNTTLDVLGPAGIYAMQTFGESLRWLLLGVLALWGFAALGVATVIFHRRAPV